MADSKAVPAKKTPVDLGDERPSAPTPPQRAASHASPEALKAAIAGLLEHTPEYLTTLQGMSPEKHEAYTKARNHAHKLVTGG